MIPGIGAAHIPALDAGSTLREVISALGLMTNLVGLYDLGDSASYSGSGQTITDLSGSANHLTLGADGTTTNDPLFAGVAGGRSSSEYIQFQNYDRYLTSSSTSFSNSLHKQNAAFTMVVWHRFAQVDMTNGNGIVSTYTGSGSPTGLALGLSDNSHGAGGTLALGTAEAGTNKDNILTGLSGSASGPVFVGFTYNEASGAWAARLNTSTGSGTQAYVNTITASASHGIYLYAGGDPSGGYSGRTYSAALWSSALTASQLSAIFDATRGKFSV